MKLAVILAVLFLSGCTFRNHEADKKELTKLAECVCASKGGYSYIRYSANLIAAKVVCHGADQMYDVRLNDECKGEQK